jgi:hypothetical protein
MSQFSGLWRQEPLTPAHNISHQHVTFLVTTQRDISPEPRLVWLECQSSKSLPKVWPWASSTLLYTPSAGRNPLLRTSLKQTSLCCSPVSLRDFPIMVLSKQFLANFSLMAIPALGMLSTPSLWAENKPGIYLGTPYATLEETWLVLAPGNLLSPVNNPLCQRQRPESGDFVQLTVFQYHLVGATWKHT